MTRQPALRVNVDAADWEAANKLLRKAAPAVRKQMMKAVREGVKRHVVPDAKRNSSWSGRIPKSIGVSVTAREVKVKTRPNTAPHAGIMEFGGRHPVFGNRAVWVNQTARPFLGPAVNENRDTVAKLVAKETENAMRSVGFKPKG